MVPPELTRRKLPGYASSSSIEHCVPKAPAVEVTAGYGSVASFKYRMYVQLKIDGVYGARF
jgi:hypothetical protein